MDLQDALKKPKEKVSAEKKGFYERPALANKNTGDLWNILMPQVIHCISEVQI